MIVESEEIVAAGNSLDESELGAVGGVPRVEPADDSVDPGILARDEQIVSEIAGLIRQLVYRGGPAGPK